MGKTTRTGLTKRRTHYPRATPAAPSSAPGLSPGRAICRGRGQLLELLGVASLGGWRGKAGEDEEGGWRAVKSEYDGIDAFVSYCRPAASSSGFFPGTIITVPHSGRPPGRSLGVFCCLYLA